VDAGLFLRGAVLGFTIAAAVGPISLLTIRRTLADGWATGMASGLGAATADGFYGGVAAFGLTAVSDVLMSVAQPLGIVGGAFLIYLGMRTLRSSPSAAAAPVGSGPSAGAASVGSGGAAGAASVGSGDAAGRGPGVEREPGGEREPRGLLPAYASILGLTLTNPMTILSFAALFVGLGVQGQGLTDAALLTAGVFFGSLSWWLALTSTVSLLRARVTPRVLAWVNLVSGAIIAGFGAVAVAASVRG
jgi:threonine/homoserine/homoserine lactone efflux protein